MEGIEDEKRCLEIEIKNYKWIFVIWKIEILKTSVSAVKRIGQRFVIKDTLNRKVSSGHPIAFTIKDDHRPKMTVLNGIRKHFLNSANIQ